MFIMLRKKGGLGAEAHCRSDKRGKVKLLEGWGRREGCSGYGKGEPACAPALGSKRAECKPSSPVPFKRAERAKVTRS